MMKLNFEQIKQITKGATYLEEVDGRVLFHRFTKEQETVYQNLRCGYVNAMQYTAGVKLMFRTNSDSVYIKADFSTKSDSRFFFSVDVFSNGKYVDSLENYSYRDLTGNYTGVKDPLGVFEKTFMFGAGEKTVCIHLPYTTKTELIELSLDDGAFIEPVSLPKKLLAFGDSITHGYDALHSSARYIAKLADYLEAEEFNKAIGGETFFPELAETKEEFEPDYIVVAYGTNDWSHGTREVFQKNCRAFYQNVSKNYPNTRIFALTPIWRKDYTTKKEFGLFGEVQDEIYSATAELENVEVIEGYNLVPHDGKYFGDLRLHPSDEGFVHYFENLKKFI